MKISMVSACLGLCLIVLVEFSSCRTLPSYGLSQRSNLITRDLSGRKEPTLFDLLVMALSEENDNSGRPGSLETVEGMGPSSQIMGGGDGEKRDNFKQAKPCYWSLVSCYRKKRGKRTVPQFSSAADSSRAAAAGFLH